VTETSWISVCDLPAALQNIAQNRPEPPHADPASGSRGKNISELEHDCLLDLLTETGGNLREVARRMGVARSTVYNKLKSLGIPIHQYRK
jgi:DNA-binding NtrC family response regulator